MWLPLEHPVLGTGPAIQACALTGNRTGDPLVRTPVLNPLSHTSQGEAENLNALLITMTETIPSLISQVASYTPLGRGHTSRGFDNA